MRHDFLKTAFCCTATILLLTGCATQNNGLLRGDVIGFSEGITTSYNAKKGMFKNWSHQSDPFDLMKNEDIEKMKRYIGNDIPRGSNTSAYYAMEVACDRIRYIRQHVTKNDKQTKYYIFLITDGLDNNSTYAAKEDYQTLVPIKAENYPDRVQKKLKSAMGTSKNLFEVYPMLYEGEDIKAIKTENNLSHEEYKNFIKNKMECFRYSSNGAAPELIMQNDFKKLFSAMRDRFISSAYEFKIPKSYIGRKIKMRFVSKNGDTGELTGDFNKRGMYYVIENIEVTGMTFNKDKSLFVKDDGMTLISLRERYGDDKSNVFFRMEELSKDEKAFVVGTGKNDVKQFYEDNGLWITNSEYNSEQFLNMDTYFILVVDGSKSLDGQKGQDTDFTKEIKMATDIIDLIINPK